MAQTAGGTYYAASSELVSSWPATSLNLANQLETRFAAKLAVSGKKVLQIVRATDSTSRTTTSTSFTDVTGMSVTITPAYNTSTVLLVASFHHYQDSGATDCRGVFALTDSSNNTISGAQEATSGLVANTATNRYVTLFAWASPATTSAVTYKLRFKSVNAGSSTQVLNANNTGQIYAIEVSA